MTEQQQLISGWRKRIKYHEKVERAQKREHKRIEARYAKKLRAERRILANLLKKGK